MKIDEIQIRVRYGETDQMGVVYHGNYALYLEMGRMGVENSARTPDYGT